jgi:hypothetical protein
MFKILGDFLLDKYDIHDRNKFLYVCTINFTFKALQSGETLWKR